MAKKGVYLAVVARRHVGGPHLWLLVPWDKKAGRPLHSTGWRHYLAAGYNKETKNWDPLAWKKGETYEKMFLVNSNSACVILGDPKNSTKPAESLRVEDKMLKHWVPRLEKGAPIMKDITLVELAWVKAALEGEANITCISVGSSFVAPFSTADHIKSAEQGEEQGEESEEAAAEEGEDSEDSSEDAAEEGDEDPPELSDDDDDAPEWQQRPDDQAPSPPGRGRGGRGRGGRGRGGRGRGSGQQQKQTPTGRKTPVKPRGSGEKAGGSSKAAAGRKRGRAHAQQQQEQQQQEQEQELGIAGLLATQLGQQPIHDSEPNGSESDDSDSPSPSRKRQRTGDVPLQEICGSLAQDLAALRRYEERQAAQKAQAVEESRKAAQALERAEIQNIRLKYELERTKAQYDELLTRFSTAQRKITELEQQQMPAPPARSRQPPPPVDSPATGAVQQMQQLPAGSPSQPPPVDSPATGAVQQMQQPPEGSLSQPPPPVCSPATGAAHSPEPPLPAETAEPQPPLPPADDPAQQPHLPSAFLT